MSEMTVTGVLLSLAGAALTLALARNCLRRDAVPALRYGARTLRGRRLRWVWVVVLAGGFAAGVEGVTVVSRDRARIVEPGAGKAVPAPGRTVVRVPFYTRSREVRPAPGAGRAGGASPAVASVLEERLELPWPFVLAAGLYWLLVVRWPVGDPDPA